MKAASDFFRTEEKLNCAQAVLRYFEFPPEKIEALRAAGGGLAPGGLCGALHAARVVLNDEEKFAELCRKFGEKTQGALTCREIKGGSGLPCPACVNLAASLAEQLK